MDDSCPTCTIPITPFGKSLVGLTCLHAVEGLFEAQIQRLTGSLVGLALAYDSTQPPGKPASTQGWTPDVGEVTATVD